MNEKFMTLLSKVQENKELLIKIGTIAAGALVGGLVVAAIQASLPTGEYTDEQLVMTEDESEEAEVVEE